MEILKLVRQINFTHPHHVQMISQILATKAEYSEDEIIIISEAALFHDIGKNEVPPEILNKPGKLTETEFEIIKHHTTSGQKQITSAIKTLEMAALVAEQHHEKLDGTGYARVGANNIHPYSKLIAVADVFDALYSKRVYKSPWSIDEIKSYFIEQTGKQFERGFVTLLLENLDEILLIYTEGEKKS
jgi:putative two-component system response regulator